jgi:NTP pyrophosphatase (non-canonical NTP hydrolase)
MSDLSEIKDRLRVFARERDWDQFHSPKNLSMAIACEAGELLELFQWLSESDSRGIMKDANEANRIRQEMADILIYLIRLADILDIELEDAVIQKIDLNAVKYPVATSKGTARKYTELDNA